MSNEEKATTKKILDARILTGVITGVVMLSAFYAGGFVLAVVVALFVYFAMKEFVHILQCKGFQPSFRIIAFMTCLLFILSVAHSEKYFPIVLFFGVVLSFCAVLFKLRQPYIANVATTVFGFIFCWLPTYVYLVRGIGAPGKGFLTIANMNPGMGYLVMLFFIILATDIGGYFFGKNFGKHQLCEVSPKKTVEGCVCGTIAAILTALFFGYILKMPVWQSLSAGIIITFFAQIGDLSESLLKRDAGVKDSGDSLPGHGGLLDRADSYILSAPVAYYFFKYVVYNDYSFANLLSSLEKVLSNAGLM
ncbi:MAG: phosphatidate cytidylyltransferase [Candidatus Gastranaerophilales bacterium]|nr:phosphatidate cytidylyltransferase [Candidatus Gastranaerophilales bacterium]